MGNFLSEQKISIIYLIGDFIAATKIKLHRRTRGSSDSEFETRSAHLSFQNTPLQLVK
jgi:hypothetical protein